MYRILRLLYEVILRKKKIIFGQNVVYERWQPSVDERYFYLSSDLREPGVTTFYEHSLERTLGSWNYFASKEHAEEAIKRVKEVLKTFHEELKY